MVTFFAVFIENIGIQGGGIFFTQLEDVADFDAANNIQTAFAIGAGITFNHVAQIGSAGCRQVTFPVNAGEVLAVFVSAADKVGNLQRGVVSDHGDV